MYNISIGVLTMLFGLIRSVFKSRQNLMLENLALRQQLANGKLKKKRADINDLDRCFWVALKMCWGEWVGALIVVKPETVVRWQRRRFGKYWGKISGEGKVAGRPQVEKAVRGLIFRMRKENGWGAPRIHGELVKLGVEGVSERTVSRYLREYKAKHPDRGRQQSWRAFLKNHRRGIAAMDFFVVPTVGFKVLYGFVVIGHQKRKVLYFNVTAHPTARWVMQQLREAFPFDTAPRYLIFDRDSIFSQRVKACIKRMAIKPKQTAYRSPWQNGVCERWILSVRSECLNHVIIFNARHLRRLLKEYVEYYNADRCHLALNKDSPVGRTVQVKPAGSAKVVAIPKVGGLQHKYVWRNAA